jgi:hypothetical protein
MHPQPQYSDELDVLENDIQLLRELVDAAVARRDASKARALTAVIDDRKARLRRAVRSRAGADGLKVRAR